METITEKLAKLSPSIFERNEGCTEEMIVGVEKEFGLKFPQDYRQLLLLSNSGSIKGSNSVFNYEPVEYLVGHNMSEFFNGHR
jgi:cell wall assembly regulator SMI1